MENEAMWQLFNDTGDPVGYLMYKAALREQKMRKVSGSDRARSGDACQPASPESVFPSCFTGSNRSVQN